MLRRPPRSTRTDTPVPDTTLCRSPAARAPVARVLAGLAGRRRGGGDLLAATRRWQPRPGASRPTRLGRLCGRRLRRGCPPQPQPRRLAGQLLGPGLLRPAAAGPGDAGGARARPARFAAELGGLRLLRPTAPVVRLLRLGQGP